MIRSWILLIVLAQCVAGAALLAAEPAAEPARFDQAALQRFIAMYCVACHDMATPQSGLDLESLAGPDAGGDPQIWEKVVRKLLSRQMPPPDHPRPREREYKAAETWLESVLDGLATKSPQPGRTETFRRLNRTEYHNTIRDLLHLDVDVSALLPPDESSHGFDNVTVADLSPALLNRYVSAAEKISRLAMGSPLSAPAGDTFRVRPDVTQDVHLEGLPLGTRGGLLIPYNFPRDGEYEIQVHLMRDRNEGVEGLHERQELELLLDRDRVKLFPIEPARGGTRDQDVDADLKVRLKIAAGPHQVGATFVKKGASLLETRRQPLNVHFNYYRHPRLGPAIYEVSIVGPFDAAGPGNTPSRQAILAGRSADGADDETNAKEILSRLARRAYRRPVTEDDLLVLLGFYRQGRAEGGFEAGIELALSALLVQPQFLFRIERDPHDVAPATAYRISDLELASRLSYFLWSSLPDEELLAVAERGELSRPGILEQQTQRLLVDRRSDSLVHNFAAQWLYLRNLEAVNPDMRLFPDFDDNLRQAMRRETELLVEDIVRADRGVLDLLKSDTTWMNERLAKHYGVPHVHGSHFRRVSSQAGVRRGGLLRQASILTVTSYATRTSPVIRGHWVLQNLVGNPPPPPPPNVPALADNTVSSVLSLRDRLQQHRANAACASCHQQMDPVGFALENFDAIGRWRKTEADLRIDVTGQFLDEVHLDGVDGLERAITARPELFVSTLVEKLLTFGLGRGIELDDAPAVRKIVREARAENYRFSRLILGIVQSVPFQMRMSP